MIRSRRLTGRGRTTPWLLGEEEMERRWMEGRRWRAGDGGGEMEKMEMEGEM